MEHIDYYEEINDNDIIDEPPKRKRRNVWNK
jgi:hypothetical protein